VQIVVDSSIIYLHEVVIVEERAREEAVGHSAVVAQSRWSTAPRARIFDENRVLVMR
jgi:hypothetical protein